MDTPDITRKENTARQLIARGRALELLVKAHPNEFGQLYADELEKMSPYLLPPTP